ncbi:MULTISPECIES: GIY-YIG nuclease family protein [Streptosporangiaceae]|uniref:GIY-YIG nuclease family protein n=1 Tax=Streptosporangiaceae TaxID=2004 RepID=UPI0033D90011
MSNRTALYRFYDEDDRLLYIGITENITARWGSHATKKAWWPEVARKDVEWFDTRALALAAETRAIITERPVHNIVHAPGRIVIRRILPRPDKTLIKPPALPLYEFIVEELARRGQTKTWLTRKSGVSRSGIDNLAKQPRTPQAGTVIALAGPLEMDRKRALQLAGLATTEDLIIAKRPVDLSAVSTADLIAMLHRLTDELHRRVKS